MNTVLDVNAEITKKKANFAEHEITVIADCMGVRQFRFARPDTGIFGFTLTTADNLIVMNGDCYSLMTNPGYGRNGLAFLRGSIGSVSYFLEKCPFRDQLTEYSYAEAMEALKSYVESEYLKPEDIEDVYGLDETQFHGEYKYYEFCREHDIDEPYSPRILTHTTMLQLAGLSVFVEKYNALEEQRKYYESINPLV